MKKNSNIVFGVTNILLFILIVGSNNNIGINISPVSAANETIVIDGSTTVQPIVSKAAEIFMGLYEGYTITIKGTGSGTGIASLIAGTCDITMASRAIKPDETTDVPNVVEHVVAADGIGVIVNPANPYNGLNFNDIRGIYNGTYDTWDQVGDGTYSGSIVVVNRETTSGTYGFFEETVVEEGYRTDDQVIEKNSNGAVHDEVAATPLAIGYVGLGYIDDEIKNLEVDGVAASVETVAAGTYPIARDLYLYTDGDPAADSLTYYFIQFIMSPFGQAIVKDEKFVPVADVGLIPEMSSGSTSSGIPGFTPIFLIAAASITFAILYRRRT